MIGYYSHTYFTHILYSAVVMGRKNLWATKVSGPKNAMTFFEKYNIWPLSPGVFYIQVLGNIVLKLSIYFVSQ